MFQSHDQLFPGIERYGKDPQTAIAVSCRPSRCDVKPAAVQRADQRSLPENAVCERTPSVRAFRLRCEHRSIAASEHRDAMTGNFKYPALPERNVLDASQICCGFFRHRIAFMQYRCR